MAASTHDSKDDEKKAAPKKKEIDMRKVVADGAAAFGYHALLESGTQSPSEAYASSFGNSFAGKEFERLAKEARALPAADAKAIGNRDALAEQYERLRIIVKEGGVAAVEGNDELFKKKEADAKAAYAELKVRAAAVGEEEKKKVEGMNLEAKIAEAQHQEIARLNAANYQKMRELYVKAQYNSHGGFAHRQRIEVEGHHQDWRKYGDPLEDKARPSGIVSGVEATDSPAENGRYFNPKYKNYVVEVKDQLDDKGEPTGRKLATPNPPANTFLWGQGYGDDSLLMSIVGLIQGGLEGGRAKYDRQYRDQIDAQIHLLKPGRANLLETVENAEGKKEKRLKAGAGFIMERPSVQHLQKAGVPADLQFHWVRAAFEQVQKVRPPIPFRENGWLDVLGKQVNAGPFYSGAGWQGFDQTDNTFLKRFVKIASFVGSYLKPGQSHTIETNLALLKELEKEINDHNLSVQKELVTHEKKAEEKAAELANERKYLDDLVVKGRRAAADDVPDFKNLYPKLEERIAAERKHYLELGAKAEIKEAAEEAKPHFDKMDNAKKALSNAIEDIANFDSRILVNDNPPADWKLCFLPPEDEVAWQRAKAWDVVVRGGPDYAMGGAPLCAEIERYLDFRGQQLPSLQRKYEQACNDWKATPHALYEKHHELWSKELDSLAMDRLGQASGAAEMERYRASEVQKDVDNMKKGVENLTRKPDDTPHVKADSPVQISAEIAKLNYQVQNMVGWEKAFLLKLTEIHNVDRDPAVLDRSKSRENRLLELRAEAYHYLGRIRWEAGVIHPVFQNYQRNKAVWGAISPDLNEKIKALDGAMNAHIGGPNRGNLLAANIVDHGGHPAVDHFHSRGYEAMIEGAYAAAFHMHAGASASETASVSASASAAMYWVPMGSSAVPSSSSVTSHDPSAPTMVQDSSLMNPYAPSAPTMVQGMSLSLPALPPLPSSLHLDSNDDAQSDNNRELSRPGRRW